MDTNGDAIGAGRISKEEDIMGQLKEYPTASTHMDRRACVWLNRERAAYRLAEYAGAPVTVESFEAAWDIYMRFTRFAIASARESENDNDPRAYKADGTPRAWHAAEADRNARRYHRLRADLAPYGLNIVWCGLYPSICKVDAESHGVAEQIAIYTF